MLVGVVSDNHRLIDPALPAVLDGVEEIWHAGDLVTPEILEALRALAPVYAIRGNNDFSRDLRALPDELLLERAGHRILLRHIVGPPGKVDREARQAIARTSPDLIVMGHSHQPLAEQANGILWLNPGSCGPRRFSLPRAAARLTIEPQSARFQVVELGTRRSLIDRTFALPAPG